MGRREVIRHENFEGERRGRQKRSGGGEKEGRGATPCTHVKVEEEARGSKAEGDERREEEGEWRDGTSKQMSSSVEVSVNDFH